MRLVCLTDVSCLITFPLFSRTRKNSELADKYVSVTFDGTTRLGEAMAVVVRFVSSDWTLEQRLMKLQMLAKSMKGEEVARELIHKKLLPHLTL